MQPASWLWETKVQHRLVLLLTTVYYHCVLLLGTAGLPEGSVYVVHERVHSINTHLPCAQVRDGDAVPPDDDER